MLASNFIILAILFSFFNLYLSFVFFILYLIQVFLLSNKGKIYLKRFFIFIFLFLIFFIFNYIKGIFLKTEINLNKENYNLKVLESMEGKNKDNNQFLNYLYKTILELESKQNKDKEDYLNLFKVYDLAFRNGIESAKNKAMESLSEYCKLTEDKERCVFAP